jgi:hypothetical protein
MPPSCTQAIYLIVAPSPNLVYITAFWRGVKFGNFYLKIIVTFDNENSKINKYLELSVAMRNLWCLEKISILPFIISATGIVPQSLLKI